MTLLVALQQKETLCGIKINYPLGWRLTVAKAVPIESEEKGFPGAWRGLLGCAPRQDLSLPRQDIFLCSGVIQPHPSFHPGTSALGFLPDWVKEQVKIQSLPYSEEEELSEIPSSFGPG